MAFLPSYGDLNSGRIGSGTLEYEVPLTNGTFRSGALVAENVAAKSADAHGPAIHVKDATRPGVSRFGCRPVMWLWGANCPSTPPSAQGQTPRPLL